MTQRRRAHWAADLCHPLPLAALVVLIVNDHAVKGSGLLPGEVTGKLSDVAGLVMFPVLLATLLRGAVRLLRIDAGDRGIVHAATLATVAGFTALKVSPAVNGFAEAVWGHNSMDGTDLYALPVCAVAWLFMLHRGPASANDRRPLRWHHATIVALAAMASAATPAPRYPRNFPTWRIMSGTPNQLGCADAHAWVAKSGKTGVGVMIELRRRNGEPCDATISGVDLVVRGVYQGKPDSRGLILHGSPRQGAAIADEHRGTLPELRSIDGTRSSVSVYVPIPFDNNRAWNRGYRTGDLRVTVDVANTKHSWTMPAVHELRGYHVDRARTPPPPRRQWRAR